MSGSDFFRWSGSERRGTAKVSLDPGQVAPASFELLKGTAMPEATLRFHVSWSRRLGDFVEGSAISHRFMSPRARQLFDDAGFTGWRPYPAIIRDHVGEHPYWGLQVTGRCGPITWDDAREEFRPPEIGDGPPYPVYVGPTFDPASWDGSDIFTPTDRSTYVLVTSRVREAVERANLTQFEFVRLPDLEALFHRPATSPAPGASTGSSAR